jgi:hypothetical protein
MPKKANLGFQHVRTVGPMLPAAVLARIAFPRAGDPLVGLRPEDYDLAKSERLNEAISRSFASLLPKWQAFRDRVSALDASDHGLGPAMAFARQICAELGYGDLARFQRTEIDGRQFELAFRWLHVPVHVVGANVPFEQRTAGARGAARVTPHDQVQTYLNYCEESLWGLLCNGRCLRVLRDNRSVTRPAFVEFDLDGIFSNQSFADFRLLWLVCHVSRLRLPYRVDGPAPVHEVMLEKWHQEGMESGKRILSNLKTSVRVAIAALGRGFLVPRGNRALCEYLASAPDHRQEYYRQLLRIVYRLLFLMVAESRDVLHTPGADSAVRERFRRHYSIDRLRDLAGEIRGGHHSDLYEGLKVLMRALDDGTGADRLGLSPLGSFLWSASSTALLNDVQLRNRDLLDAVRAIAFTIDDGARVPIDYKNLGSEELGSVYEQLLELNPTIDPQAVDESKRFVLETAAGNDRKTSGSYYTPHSLVQCLLDSALEPVIKTKVHGKKGVEAAEAILSMKVCDPAVGSGHFLIAAAHRMAARVASFRTGEEQPGEAAHRAALRDVIRRCLYGIDINPMSAELCKVALWMESMEPGKPLSFLDGHIAVGNSLIGTTPALIAQGIPDGAFEVLEGDDKKVCSELKKQNKGERAEQSLGQGLLDFAIADSPKFGNEFAAVALGDDDSVSDIGARAARYRRLVDAPTYRNAKLLADAWCAAFFWRKDGSRIGGIRGITTAVLREIELHPDRFGSGTPVRDEIDRLAARHGFLHLHIAFPEVFGSGGPSEPVLSAGRVAQ